MSTSSTTRTTTLLWTPPTLIDSLVYHIVPGSYSAELRPASDSGGEYIMEPDSCNLPSLVNYPLTPLDDTDLPTIDKDCLLTFIPTPVVPLPYVDITLPGITCPNGIVFDSDPGIIVTVNGNASDPQHIYIDPNPNDACTYSISGNIDIPIDDFVCPTGITIKTSRPGDGESRYRIQFGRVPLFTTQTTPPPTAYLTTRTSTAMPLPTGTIDSGIQMSQDDVDQCIWNLDDVTLELPYVPCPEGYKINTDQFFIKVVDPNTNTVEMHPLGGITPEQRARLHVDIPKMFVGGATNGAMYYSVDNPPAPFKKAGAYWPEIHPIDSWNVNGIAHNEIMSNGFDTSDDYIVAATDNGFLLATGGSHSFTTRIGGGQVLDVVYNKKLKTWFAITSTGVLATKSPMNWASLTSGLDINVKIACNNKDVIIAGYSNSSIAAAYYSKGAFYVVNNANNDDPHFLNANNTKYVGAATIVCASGAAGRYMIGGSDNFGGMLFVSDDGKYWTRAANIPGTVTAIGSSTSQAYYAVGSNVYSFDSEKEPGTDKVLLGNAATGLASIHAIHGDEGSIVVAAGMPGGYGFKWIDLSEKGSMQWRDGQQGADIKEVLCLTFRSGHTDKGDPTNTVQPQECEISMYPGITIDLPKVPCQDGIEVNSTYLDTSVVPATWKYTFDIKNVNDGNASILTSPPGKTDETGPLRVQQRGCDWTLRGVLSVAISAPSATGGAGMFWQGLYQPGRGYFYGDMVLVTEALARTLSVSELRCVSGVYVSNGGSRATTTTPTTPLPTFANIPKAVPMPKAPGDNPNYSIPAWYGPDYEPQTGTMSWTRISGVGTGSNICINGLSVPVVTDMGLDYSKTTTTP